MVLRSVSGLSNSQVSFIKVPKKGKKLIAKVIWGQIVKDECHAKKLGFYPSLGKSVCQLNLLKNMQYFLHWLINYLDT